MLSCRENSGLYYATGYAEAEKIGLYLTGNKYNENWRITNRKTDFFDLKASVDALLLKMKCNATWKNLGEDNSHNLSSIFENAATLVVNGNEIGICGNIKKQILSDFDIKQTVFFAERNNRVHVYR